MEYCEKTLRTYINKRNTDLSLGTRKRLALQFLFALNYLHTQGEYVNSTWPHHGGLSWPHLRGCVRGGSWWCRFR